jgi:cellulose synthase/poly-beta-1,6-N-acetylglucosamine synthase-like glycosyltransferase
MGKGPVLPCAPNDKEKVLYLKKNRFLFFGFGMLALLAVSIGNFLFIKSNIYFIIIIPYYAYVFVYLSCSYLISFFGKDYDYNEHKRLIVDQKVLEYQPSVDIFLPCCGEPLEILNNTYTYVKKIEYSDFKVHVLDDKDKEEVKNLAAKYGFNYIVRDNRPHLKKAGNLRYAFQRTSGDLFVILDADFCPRHDFLKETVPYFYKYKKLAILQTPQFFRVRDEQTWVEKGAGAVQELFYRLVQTSRNTFHASICVGTSAVYRREALAPFGGTYEIEHSEDVHTGFNAVENGWILKYLPINLSMGCCPDSLASFFTQQYRWASGSTTLLSSKMFWISKLNWKQKMCFLCGMFYYSATALSIFFNPLPAILLIFIAPEKCLYYNIAFNVPSFIFSMFIMRWWSKQPFKLYVMKIRIFTNYASLLAILDKIFKTQMEWKVSGSKNKKNSKFQYAIAIMIIWTGISTLLTVGGIIWRSLQYNFYNFIPTLFFTLFNLFLTIEIFTGEEYRKNILYKLKFCVKIMIFFYILKLTPKRFVKNSIVMVV